MVPQVEPSSDAFLSYAQVVAIRRENCFRSRLMSVVSVNFHVFDRLEYDDNKMALMFLLDKIVTKFVSYTLFALPFNVAKIALVNPKLLFHMFQAIPSTLCIGVKRLYVQLQIQHCHPSTGNSLFSVERKLHIPHAE